MSGLSSPSHGVAMATIHFSIKVASFYFSGLIMTKYQKGSCILDILPSMVNKGLKSIFVYKSLKSKVKKVHPSNELRLDLFTTPTNL